MAILDIASLGYVHTYTNMHLEGSGDLRARANPLLLVTCEDAYGVVRHALARTDVSLLADATTLPPIRSMDIPLPFTRVRGLPRSR